MKINDEKFTEYMRTMIEGDSSIKDELKYHSKEKKNILEIFAKMYYLGICKMIVDNFEVSPESKSSAA